MKKFTLLIASLFITMGAIAQSTVWQRTSKTYSADELNALTEATYIAVKNLSGTNGYYLAANANVQNFGYEAVLVWEPAVEGVAGTYHIRRLSVGDNGYIQAATSGAVTLGAKATAQVFVAVTPNAPGGETLNSDNNGILVRFKQNDANTWLNCQNKANTPILGNTGQGGWTMHNVYGAEEVSSFNVTYRYMLDGVEKKAVTVEQAIGSAYALPIDFPYVTEAFDEGTVAGAATVDVTCELQDMPFVAAASYGEITQWYNMQIRDDGFTYLQYDAAKAYIPASQSAAPTNSKNSYAWGFVGDPFNGFEIVNYEAGDAMVLSAPEAPTGDKNATQLARMVTKQGATGNTTWTIAPATHSNAVENTFYVIHPTATSYAFNRQTYNSENALCYWNGRDTGSALRVIECEISTLGDELVALVAQAQAQLTQIEIGTGVGKYSSSYENYETVYAEIVAYSQNIPATATDEEIQEKIDNLQAIIASFSLNMPEAGRYYTIRNVDNYITSATQNNQIVCGTINDATAIYYYDGSHLLAYSTGLYFGLDSSDWTFEQIGSNDISAITFVAAENGAVAKYNVKSADRWLHISHNATDDYYYVNRCQNNTCGDAHNWTIEEVTELPVTVTAAGKATLFAPVALTVPADVKAYTVATNGEWAVLTDIGTTIPAETGVVLEAAEGTYNFAITTTDATAESELEGTVASEYVTANAYVLGIKDEVVAFYTATTEGQADGTFLNNGHKAYLPKPEGSNVACYSFRFGEGTTGIEEITDNREQSTVIYDLTGRRVEAITAPGIYVVNGKKVLVK